MAAFATPLDAGWTLSSGVPVRVPADLRYAGTRLAALRAQRATDGELHAPAAGIVRSVVAPAGDPLAGLTVVELQVNPFAIRRVAQAIAFGLPTFYFVLDPGSTTAAFVAGDMVPAGATLATAAGTTILCAGQDRLARDAALWSAQIGVAIAAAGADAGTWPVFAAAVAAQTASGPNPPVILLDHTGAPLRDEDIQISAGSQTAVAHLTEGDRGDLQRAVARLHASAPAQMPFATVFGNGSGPVRIGGAPGSDAELTRLEDGAGAQGSIEVTPALRHVVMTDLKRWFAPQYANAALPPDFDPLADYTRNNKLTTFTNGLAYYADLLDKLHDAADAAPDGGLHLVGGWQTFPDTKLARRGDDETAAEHPVTLLEAVKLLGDPDGDGNATGGGKTRVLSPQFFALEQNSTPEPAEIIIVTLLVEGLFAGSSVSAIRSDAGGLVILAMVFVANAVLVPWIIDVNGRPFEPNVDAVDELGAAANAVSRFAPFPARIEDNPLNDLNGFPWDSLLTLQRHFGFYHQKFGIVRAGGAYYGYCGGIDINPNRLDDARHVAHGPYHDVHARVEGRAARDVALSFEQRWSRDGSGTLAFDTPEADALGDPGDVAAQVARTYYRPADPARRLPWAPNGDRTIAATLGRAIDAAREFISIEDQYFTAAPVFQELLLRKVSQQEIGALVIVLPAIGDQPFGEQVRSGFIADLRAADTQGIVRIGYPRRHYTVPDNDLRASSGRLVLQADLAPSGGLDPAVVLGPKSRLPGPPFWLAIEGELMYVVDESTAPNPDPLNARIFEVVRGADTHLVKGLPNPLGARARAHPRGAAATVVDVAGIYVHAKTTIVDDVFAGIGSANINRRGHYHDGEIALFSVPQRLKASRSNPVAALRRRLWAEILDLPLATAEPLLQDPIAAAKLFGRSPLLGNRFTDIEAQPAHLMLGVTGGDGIVVTLLKTAIGIDVAANLQELYDGVIDPTSGLEFDP
jgi:phosphatidylserine/phosphatidylglycerophosphate/cardiolipin synthase-like enzyme